MTSYYSIRKNLDLYKRAHRLLHVICLSIKPFLKQRHAHTWWSELLTSAQCCLFSQCQYVYGCACLTSVYTFTWLSRNNEDKGHKNVKWQLSSIGWMDWDGGLTWAAPKNSSAVLTGGSTEMMSWPQSKPTYLYMLVLKSSWACGSGQESAHCCSTHCSALSCWALVRHSETGWRALCPVQISTSSKWPMTSGLD